MGGVYWRSRAVWLTAAGWVLVTSEDTLECKNDYLAAGRLLRIWLLAASVKADFPRAKDSILRKILHLRRRLGTG